MRWEPLSFSDLDGWQEDDHSAALACFRLSAKAFVQKSFVSRIGVPPSESLLTIASKSLEAKASDNPKAFFEAHFQPKRLSSDADGFVTAYFEPVVDASRTKSKTFPYPIYKRPTDLVRLDENEPRPPNLASDLQYAKKVANGFIEFPDRKQIDEGALSDLGLEMFWVKSAIEAFFIHVQGSARLSFADGSSSRIAFAGKSGHPYSSIGKLLVSRGVFTAENANMKNLREWLEADEQRALEVLHHNRSYIFFSEVPEFHPDFGPIAAAGVPLTPGRSLAVDKSIHAYGTPVWLNTDKPLPSQTANFQRLMIAQDTGSAIVGPERGDIFIGSGDEAGLIAGSVRHKTEFIVFAPKGIDE